MTKKSLQETYAPNSICFGCGPANIKGLRIRSFPAGEEVIAEWDPQDHHEAFPGMLSGGIVGTLLDCHSNWTAAWKLMHENKLEHPPCTVTAEYSIKLLRPTPSNKPVQLKAKPVSCTDRKVNVVAELISEGEICATCTGTFVSVKPGHPAYHRWG